MAKKLYEESNIQAIADAIREKNGETTTYKPSEMAAAITAITTGGGDIEIEPIVLTGGQEKACSGQIASNYIKYFGNTITTNNLTDTDMMFEKSTLEYIPFDLNYDTRNYSNISSMFSSCNNLKELPKMNNTYPNSHIINLFASCYNLRYIPEDYFDTWNLSKIKAETSSITRCATIFQYCYSLRSMPLAWMKGIYPKASYTSSMYYSGFERCYSLDELVNIPIPHTGATWTGNAFGSTFPDCHRLKNITFETNEDGTPVVIQWKSQNIDLTNYVGYVSASNKNNILNYNSGITADKEVTDDATYQALKDDPDWFTTNIAYSRYNHDSAVATINSLPDTSAYLTTAGGTNTIKFKGASGSATDGGAINTLTEEEIAVAAAKGWTVTLV